MNDAYMPLESRVRLTRGALEIIASNRFPVHVLTKSDLILRDIDLLAAINERAAGASPGAVISFTVTTVDDDLAAEVEPGASSPSKRLVAVRALAARGIRTGVMLMPVLPFIEDSVKNITEVVTKAHASRAQHVVAFFGMTLRDRSRAYHYDQLDRLFPGVRERYERAYAGRYEAPSPRAEQLEAVFAELVARYGLERRVPPYQQQAPQLSLF